MGFSEGHNPTPPSQTPVGSRKGLENLLNKGDVQFLGMGRMEGLEDAVVVNN
jgi:hypothetical protein